MDSNSNGTPFAYIRALTPAKPNRIKSQNIAKNSTKQLTLAFSFSQKSHADEQ